MEEKIEEFEELEEPKKNEGAQQSEGGGARPDFRIVQPENDAEGNVVYRNVGGMWKRVSKNGNEFYTLRIGKLKLLVFANDRGDYDREG